MPGNNGVAKAHGLKMNKLRRVIQKNKTFRLLNYNIEGLFNKLDDVDFVQFVNKFDFVCLTETFLNFELNHNVFKDFKLYNAP
uniref:hypothetical protein n=1 Tax=Thiolapillus sp. TaxID=2017437 RepID=UPI003AF8BC6C